VCAAVIYQQLEHIRSSDPGYQREHIITIRLQDPLVRSKLDVVQERTLQVPGVAAFSASTHLPVDVGSSTGVTIVGDDGVSRESQTYQLYTDPGFLDVYGIQLLAGRFLPDKRRSWDEPATEFVINETFARTFGLSSPVGKTFTKSGRTATIIGVVKDFHMHSFRQQIAPLFIANRDAEWVNHVSIRLREGDIRRAVEGVRESFAGAAPGQPFEYTFLDETFNRMYERDARLGTIVSLFTGLALFIASMGLFGLATFVAQDRRKEIGIRKVLGATSASMAVLLSREFLVMVLLANLIAWPVAYFVMSDWLREFAYRIALGPGLFLSAGLAAATIAILTVNIQAARAVRANPVESLRYE
jgi:putative ABC transport system permease protein